MFSLNGAPSCHELATPCEHVLEIIFDASQIEEGVHVVELAADLPLLVVHPPLLVLERMPELVLEILPSVGSIGNIIIRSPQSVHRSKSLKSLQNNPQTPLIS